MWVMIPSRSRVKMAWEEVSRRLCRSSIGGLLSVQCGVSPIVLKNGGDVNTAAR